MHTLIIAPAFVAVYAGALLFMAWVISPETSSVTPSEIQIRLATNCSVCFVPNPPVGTPDVWADDIEEDNSS